MTNKDELKQKLAAIEHERWADWQKWCHQVLREQLNPNGMHTDLEDVLSRWDKQIATEYKDLSDAEKASDMEQVDRYWPLIEAHISKLVAEGKRDQTKQILDMTRQSYLKKAPIANITHINESVIAVTNSVCEMFLASLSTDKEAA